MRNVDLGWSATHYALPCEGDGMVERTQEIQMDITTLLVIVLILVLLGGGGFYGRGRWY